MKRAIVASLLLLAFDVGMARSDDQLPISFERGDPIVETFAYEGREVAVSRRHCVDKMGPDSNGLYEFRYEYDLYEFTHGSEILHARSYTNEPESVHFLGIERGGQRILLAETDLGKPLPKAAQDYFREAGKANLTWLDPNNETSGYSPVP